jgi:hypothetical protein
MEAATMGKKDILTKILAIFGTVLVGFPILAPVILTIVTTLRSGIFRFDYLMPAELFPAVIAGGGLLLWAALRAHARRALVGWGLAGAAGLLVGGQVLAVATGIASGASEPAGVFWLLIVASIVGYSLLVVEMGIAGILLLRDLYPHN